jgi:hypothetical protein
MHIHTHTFIIRKLAQEERGGRLVVFAAAQGTQGT